AVRVGEGADFGDPLAALDVALDDPVERAAVDDLGAARRHHAGGVPVLRRLAVTPSFIETGFDPFFEVLDAVAADAQFQDVERHGPNLAPARRAFNAVRRYAQIQHSTTLTASPPRLVSLYFSFMSRPVWRIVSMAA